MTRQSSCALAQFTAAGDIAFVHTNSQPFDRRDSALPTSAALPEATTLQLVPKKRPLEQSLELSEADTIAMVRKMSKYDMQSVLITLAKDSETVRIAVRAHHDSKVKARPHKCLF